MALSWEEIQAKAIAFAKRWEAAENEEAQAQSFLTAFLQVFGVSDPESQGDFEYKVALDDGHAGYIDYLWKGQIAIEMKSRGKDLKKAHAQLKEYVIHLPEAAMPPLLMTCDFENIVLYERTSGKRTAFKTKDLRRHVRRFAALAGYETSRERDSQLEVNVRAAEKMALLHDALKENGYEGHELEVYLVRLLFCLFADDTGIFPQGQFADYVENSRPDGGDLAERLERLFQVLDQGEEKRARQKLLSPTLLQFRYINGALFSGALPLAAFDARMRTILLDCCDFDWNKISPAIFGAMFQGVMDKAQRRELGAHYTSEENILKLINPLFMDELWQEFESAKSIPARLDKLHERIASLKFLDPACGCGNFLIIAYRELRRLELAILKMKIASSQKTIGLESLVKVRVSQFYGIEKEDFPCQIARVGLWLMDHLMNLEVAAQFGEYFARLPLKDSAHLVHANALALDWNELAPARELSFIFGNPPFSGARVMGGEQKQDTLEIFKGVKNVGNLDYVCCWFRKAADMMNQNPAIRTALVATNSICQGEQASLLWQPLFAEGFKIDFAWRTFKWSNEARGKAAVHCVIVGFSKGSGGKRLLFDEEGKPGTVAQINAYLADAPQISVSSRQKPLCPVPEIGMGNQPIDGGHYLFAPEEMAEFLALEPLAQKYFRPWLGAEEFINSKKRFCLWLGHCPPEELREMPLCLERVANVKEYRLASSRPSTRKLANAPRRFQTENMPDKEYIVIPKVSSEKRQYIPIGFISNDTLSSDLLFLIAKSTLYHFGILTSSAHNAWMRAVAGRLEMRYRYSKDLVYNNFPWPKPSEAQKAKIEKLAQGVLDARALYPEASLADLYDPLTMPDELFKAHQRLDAAVLVAYGFAKNLDEAGIVAKLFELYARLAEEVS